MLHSRKALSPLALLAFLCLVITAIPPPSLAASHGTPISTPPESPQTAPDHHPDPTKIQQAAPKTPDSPKTDHATPVANGVNNHDSHPTNKATSHNEEPVELKQEPGTSTQDEKATNPELLTLGAEYRVGKSKFLHLDQWKGEILQYVAQMKADKSTTVLTEQQEPGNLAESDYTMVDTYGDFTEEEINLEEQLNKAETSGSSYNEKKPQKEEPKDSSPEPSTPAPLQPTTPSLDTDLRSEVTEEATSALLPIVESPAVEPSTDSKVEERISAPASPTLAYPSSSSPNPTPEDHSSQPLEPSMTHPSPPSKPTQNIVQDLSSPPMAPETRPVTDPNSSDNSSPTTQNNSSASPTSTNHSRVNSTQPRSNSSIVVESIATAATTTPTRSSQNSTGKDKDSKGDGAPTTASGEKSTSKPDSSSTPKDAAPSSSRPSSRRRLRKNRLNYASVDCGAKVLAANDEAVDPSSVLVGSKDRYMLNPCSAPRQWVVLELCEQVGIDLIKIGNFEFFSSMIKEVQVLASNRYPTASWALLGNFTLSNERELQSLDFGDEAELFPEWFKYIKIRILSHWGNEFYCPITEIQVHGLPYVEKLQQELRRNSAERHEIVSFLKDDASSQASATVNNGVTNAQTLQSGAHSKMHTHHPDPVMPMEEYLEKHKSKTVAYFNDVYSTALGEVGGTTNTAMSGTSARAVSGVETAKDRDGIVESESSEHGDASDVNHPGIPPLVPRIGADDELEETGEHMEEGAEDPTDKAQAKLSASTIPTMNLIKTIVQRVKALEIEQTLLSRYLANVSSMHEGEIQELGVALADLTTHFRLLWNIVSNASESHVALESRVRSMKSEVSVSQKDLRDSVQSLLISTLRIYLLYSALLSIIIGSIVAGLVVIILRCIPAAEKSTTTGSGADARGGEQQHAVKTHFRTVSEPVWADDSLGSRSGSTGIYIKEDPLMHLALTPPSTPPPPEPEPEEKKPTGFRDFWSGHHRRHSEPLRFGTH